MHDKGKSKHGVKKKDNETRGRVTNMKNRKEYFLQKAQENFPKMFYEDIKPIAEKTIFVSGDSVVLDLGNHYVGKFSFSMDVADDFITAPVHLAIRFGEDMREINDDFDAYKGTLAQAWLQEERVIVDYPQMVQLTRRYACRYIKITVKEARRPLVLDNFCFTASTSADHSKLKQVHIADERLRKIDEVSVNTLKECMQTFMEDGPKRDRRMWIGDLRLEALVNYCTFDNLDIIRRCLYLFAAGEYDQLGFMPSFVYETPYFFSGRDHIADYALLYVVAVCDYYNHSKDTKTVLDLVDVCKEQLESMHNILDDRGIVIKQEGWFTFIDWCPGLQALTSLHGVYMYALNKFIGLLDTLDDFDREKYEKELKHQKEVVRKYLFNEEKAVFENDVDGRQLSVHSQVWMILGGALSKEEGRYALQATLDNEGAKQPVTPYMRHYVMEAMLKLEMKDEAIDYLKKIWGAMVDMDADTYFEVYVPGDPEFSPYSDRMVNSLCHAWSSTPAYFIRNYFVENTRL